MQKKFLVPKYSLVMVVGAASTRCCLLIPVGATVDEVFFAVGFSDLDTNKIIGEVGDNVRLGRGGQREIRRITISLGASTIQSSDMGSSATVGHSPRYEKLYTKMPGFPRMTLPSNIWTTDLGH